MKFQSGNHEVFVSVPDQTRLKEEISDRLSNDRGFRLATLNLDHLVKIRQDAAFARAYAAQDLIVADGRPIVWLSRLAGDPVALMPGSDLVRPLCELAARNGWPVALLGSTENTLRAASTHLQSHIPDLKIAATISPSMQFDPDGAEADAFFGQLNQSGARLCFLALGAPKQERLAARGAKLAPAIGFASIGAGLDFLGGRQRRAPRWIRALALEWLWRTLSNPSRMIPRYAKCFAILPGQAVNALKLRSKR